MYVGKTGDKTITDALKWNNLVRLYLSVIVDGGGGGGSAVEEVVGNQAGPGIYE
jgi:hypothetical protein